MEPQDKAMYELLKIQGDNENIMQFGYHIGQRQMMNDLTSGLINVMKDGQKVDISK